YVKVIEKKYFAETLENCQNKNNTIIIKYKLFKKYNKLFLRVDEYFYTLIEKERLVKEELNDDFINNNLDNLAIEVEIFGRKVRQTLNNDNFSLELIDKDFINTLSENEKLDIEISEYNGTSFAEYNIPILSFAGSRLVNFQINLDSSEEDIVNSIKQLKKEANNIKTSNQILYSEDRVDQNIKISNKILSKGRKKIINFAEALYV
ncbi:hypothetical protein Q6A86_09815, partial [Aliarcobacter skirrowii]|uniref:hypothetical protein n=1 Tax=Aliarcobacter skirrowii TaxID=28200 RepID=UPI0029B1DD1D